MAAQLADDFGTTPLTGIFTVFVDHPQNGSVRVWRSSSRYTASALANWAADLGYRVEADLWTDDGTGYASIRDAMPSPDVWNGYGLADLPPARLTAPTAPARSRLVCTGCGDRQPDADVEREGVSHGAYCVWLDCTGTYRDPS